jgi:mannose-6-phosphate isomerase-like protein (cupin superfamily)
MGYHVFSADSLKALSARSPDARLFEHSSGGSWASLVVKEPSSPSMAELHETEADTYVVLEGRAELHLGGTLVNPTSPRPGQLRASSLEGAQCHELKAGDVVHIPERVAHWVATVQSRLVYLVFKTTSDPCKRRSDSLSVAPDLGA